MVSCYLFQWLAIGLKNDTYLLILEKRCNNGRDSVKLCKARPSVSSVMYMVVTRSPLSRVFLGRCEGELVCMLVCFEKLVWRACVAPC